MSSAYIFPENPSPYLRSYKRLWDATHAWSQELMADCLDDDCVYQLLPKSLKKPLMTKKEFSDLVGSFLIPTFTDFKVNVDDITEVGNTLVVHASPTAKVAQTGADWSSEYILILQFKPAAGPDDVPKIVSMREFLDSWSILSLNQ